VSSRVWLPWVLVAALALALGFTADSCWNGKRALEKQEAKYNEFKRITEYNDALLNAQIANSNAIIVLREERIRVLESDAVVLTNQVSQLTNALASANEPPTTAEQEALPIVLFLRARDKMQEQRFSLAMADNLKDHQVIDELKLIIIAKDSVIAAWSKKYDAEHSLRMMGEDLYSSSTKVIARLERGLTTRNVLVGLAAGAISYLAVKK
jgi:hypothetical protein